MPDTKESLTKRRGKPETVDEYIASAPQEDRAALEALRQAIREAAPNATELISYRIPAYKYNGFLVFFAAFKDHLSFFVPGKFVFQKFAGELKPYHISGATIHFTAKNPLPTDLIIKIVRMRMEENEKRAGKQS